MVGYGRCLGVNNSSAECEKSISLLKKSRRKKTSSGRCSGKKRRKASQWQQESLFKEVLEQIERSADTDCGPQTLRCAHIAMKLGNWKSFKEECRKEGKLCEWTFERSREAYEKVAMDDIGRLDIAQDILRKSTDFLRRIIAPVDGMGGVSLSYVCPHCNCFPLDDYSCGCRRGTETATTEKRSIATGGARLAEANTNGEPHTGYWWHRSVSTPMMRRCSKRTQRRWVA